MAINNSYRNITMIVESILIDIPETRNSDYLLWFEVIKAVLKPEGTIALLKIWSIEEFLTRGYKSLPRFATVSRVRRKLQKQRPELRGSKTIQKARAKREEEHRKYALDERIL